MLLGLRCKIFLVNFYLPDNVCVSGQTQGLKYYDIN